MARNNVASLSQYLSLGSAITTAYPFTFCCWCWMPNVTTTSTIMAILPSAGGANYFSLYADGATAGDPVSLEVAASGSYDLVSSTTGYRLNTWFYMSGVFASATSRSVYCDGGGKATSTVSRTPSSTNRTMLGAYVASDFTGYYDCRIADPAFWNVALSDDEVYLLAKGRKSDGSRYRPWDIQRDNLISCPQMQLGGIAAVPDRITSVGSWTVNGGMAPMPTPKFLRPVDRRRCYWPEQAAGGGGGGAVPRLTLLGVG